MTPIALCLGLLAIADADSGRVVGCCEYRVPGVDQVERGAPCYARIVAEARAALDGVTVLVDCAAPRDRFGRVLTAPELPSSRFAEPDVGALALARGWASPRRYDARRHRWRDPAPRCAP